VEAVISIRGLVKTYPLPAGEVAAVAGVDLDIATGEFVAVVGRSGSGKTTLLNLLAGIDRPTAGDIRIAGQSVPELRGSRLAAWRGRTIGLVFQFFQLLPTLTVAENVMLPMDLCRTVPARRRRVRALDLLDRVGIADQADKLPAALSGGQQQRAAIARALANDAPVLLADEPTGNLDSATSDAVLELFAGLAADGSTVLMVTHERDVSRYATRHVTLADGRVCRAGGRGTGGRAVISVLRLRKVARDLWLTRARIAMMIVAIALSVLAVSAFLSARAILGREISRNYLDTHPASATLDVPGGVDPATLAAVRAAPEVSDAVARTSRLARVKVGDGPWRVLMLFAADPADPRRVSTVAVTRGSWPPPADGLLLERTALPFLGVGTGDRVLVEVPDGTPTSMIVSGAVHDGAVAPAAQEQSAYGYVTTAGLARLGAPATPDQLKIVVGDGRGPSGDARQIEAVAQRLAATLAARGRPVTRVEVPPPLRHPHQGQLAMVGFVLLAFGLTALLLSAVLVATMLGGMLAGQLRQIGAMKAVGARTGQILGMYLTQAAGIAVLATALAVVPGIALGRVLAARGADLLNLDLTGCSRSRCSPVSRYRCWWPWYRWCGAAGCPCGRRSTTPVPAGCRSPARCGRSGCPVPPPGY
jgi:putative ABC transport system ATP-binding protein